jgi:dephospho-CoA kinase
MDAIILVVAPKELRISRVMKRDGVSEESVQARMENQWNDEEKIPLAKFVVHNDGQKGVLQVVEKILDELNSYELPFLD